MKKSLFVFAVLIAGAVLVITLQKDEKSHSAAENKPVEKNASTTSSAPSPRPTASTTANLTIPTIALDNDLTGALRKALAHENHEGLEKAYIALVQSIRQHPERVDHYIAVMRTETDEQTLRAFTFALAEAEAGLLENDSIIKAALELAKDSTFEQRQHIMLHLMSKLPELREDVFEAIVEISKADPNGQVKTSGVVVLADWMEQFPDQSEMLMQKVTDIFRTATDEDVRVFTYQVLALHKEQLTPELHALLRDRLQTEPDPFSGNLIACALFTAPDEIRLDALTKVRSAFGTASDLELKRNLLLQMVCLSRGDLVQLLENVSKENNLMAEDARDYLAVISSGGPFEPQHLLAQKAIRDASHDSCDHSEHQKK